MSRFKQLWLSFYRQNRGFGMIETAILLPMFLMITFGVIEFGNMYMARYQARDVASSVRDYLQGNPSASSADLQTFVTNLGFGSLKNTGSGEENNVFAKINIQSGTTMMTAAQFDTLCSGGGGKNWANPWLGGDPADDKNDYYIHICYPYTYNTITPVSELTVGAVPETKTMNNKAMAYITKEVSCPDGQVLQSFTGGSATCVAQNGSNSCPSGQTLEKIVDGIPFCAAKSGTYICASGQVVQSIKDDNSPVCVDRDAGYACPEGQVLQAINTNNSGAQTCVPIDKNYECFSGKVLMAVWNGGAYCVYPTTGWAECPDGQFVYATWNGVPYCKPISATSTSGSTSGSSFGGTYITNLQDVCKQANPKTGGCSCAGGTSPTLIGHWLGQMWLPGDNPDKYYCAWWTTPGNQCGYRSYACY